MTNAFSHLPAGAGSHFRLYLYAAVYRLVHALHRLHPEDGRDLRGTLERHPILAGYVEQMLPLLPDDADWEALPGWWAREIAAWEETQSGPLPLAALRRREGLMSGEVLMLLGVGLVEEDARFGTLFASLHAPLEQRRPTLDLLARLLADGSADPADAASVARGLVARGLAEILNPDAPRAEWVLRIPPPLWDLIRGDRPDPATAGVELYEAERFPAPEDLQLEPQASAQVGRAASSLAQGEALTLVLRGMAGSDRLQVMGAVARHLGLGIAATSSVPVGDPDPTTRAALHRLGPLCTLGNYLPVLRCDPGPGETATLPDLSGYHGPVGVILGREGGLDDRTRAAAMVLTLPPPRAEQRRQYWRRAFRGRPVRDLEDIVERFRLPPGHIRRLARDAVAAAALEGREEVAAEDVRRASRTLNRQYLDSLAAPVAAEGGLEQLVVSEPVAAKLRELRQRCRHRERLPERLGKGFGEHTGWGVRALFGGPSGTGKTLAARLLAAELGMDLYRVDLGAVVNKYIGETEKNLHRVLTKAEELDVILLLDEGDALMGGRTEVKSANDRYANLETDYLLQRLESGQGIVLVTTNTVQNIDPAFQRRMDVVVSFLPPASAERLRIWQLHLPDDHGLLVDELETIAARHRLTGGQIRNAALHAALLALDAGDESPAIHHVEEALRSEYRKAGAVYPAPRSAIDLRGEYGDVQAFVGAFGS